MKKRPDLIVLIAVWEFISAAGLILPIIFILGIGFFMPFSSRMGYWGYEGTFPGMGNIAIFMTVFVFLFLGVYFGVALAGGIGLLRGREWGRIISIVHAALSLFWFPVGTVIGALALVYLLKPEVREYFQEEEQAAPQSSPPADTSKT
jgi:hypothetical protein